MFGGHVIDACSEQELDVPEQVAAVVAMEDRSIAAALDSIRQNVCRNLSDAEAVQSKTGSQHTGTTSEKISWSNTPEEIRHIQIKRAQKLLLR